MAETMRPLDEMLTTQPAQELTPQEIKDQNDMLTEEARKSPLPSIANDAITILTAAYRAVEADGADLVIYLKQIIEHIKQGVGNGESETIVYRAKCAMAGEGARAILHVFSPPQPVTMPNEPLTPENVPAFLKQPLEPPKKPLTLKERKDAKAQHNAN